MYQATTGAGLQQVDIRFIRFGMRCRHLFATSDFVCCTTVELQKQHIILPLDTFSAFSSVAGALQPPTMLLSCHNRGALASLFITALQGTNSALHTR